ncbi:hypothetical protein [Pedobacter hartonius]|uniref:Uncharacterized protein n=1 Tax=Pedobacter hartonius TaxID=425514 RepID=A0A1H4G757_9SPHI|nr:hypothetical protein [Pedobacter hartonius]SEB05384.1 hypothetical protein SAMN05443550_10983 [Pedobacter hartonius]
MNEFDGLPETIEILLSGNDAIRFTGPLNRQATDEEIEELALFFATDYISSNIEVLGESFDEITYITAVDKEKQLLIKELYGTISVMDLVNLDLQIFHVYGFMISKAKKTDKIQLSDGFSRIMKRNGILKELNDDDFWYI